MLHHLLSGNMPRFVCLVLFLLVTFCCLFTWQTFSLHYYVGGKDGITADDIDRLLSDDMEGILADDKDDKTADINSMKGILAAYQNIKRDRLVQHSSADGADDVITIMPYSIRWTGDRVPYWFGSLGTEAFETCPEQRCSIVNKTSKADAVLISHNRLRSAHVHNFKLPERASLQQKWVFFSIESPQNCDIDPRYHHLFNATWTYRQTSDAAHPYGKVVPRNEPVTITYDNEETFKRKGNVVWLVSHCITNGGREIYAESLAEHIDVSVYGKCGKYRCPEGIDCRIYLGEHYKFYLSFENSLCEDYVTEKLFAILRGNMIPVVYGYYDYKNNLPPHSYIDVQDFNSPWELANYLKRVSSNKTLFDEYFHWKKDYRVKQDFYKGGRCILCEYLHRSRNAPSRTVHLDQIWSEKNSCISKEQYLRSAGVDI